jgi:hypothetical protein
MTKKKFFLSVLLYFFCLKKKKNIFLLLLKKKKKYPIFCFVLFFYTFFTETKIKRERKKIEKIIKIY